MALVRTYTFKPEIMERFERLVKNGQRSLIVAKLVSEYCDKIDEDSTSRKLRDSWIQSSVSPFIIQYSKDNSVHPYELLSSKGVIRALKAAGIEATPEDVKCAIEHILMEEP